MCPDTLSAEEFAALPGQLSVRLIRTTITAKGFRTREVTIATTLTDAGLYPADTLRELYARRHSAQAIHASANQPRKQAELINRLLEDIAGDLVPHRPGRLEPRARKRRPKNYQPLTRPRSEMKVIAHREKYRAPRPKTVLS